MPKKIIPHVSSLRRRLMTQERRLGKYRDELRDLIDDSEAQLDSVDRARTALNEAIDALSEYV